MHTFSTSLFIESILMTTAIKVILLIYTVISVHFICIFINNAKHSRNYIHNQ